MTPLGTALASRSASRMISSERGGDGLGPGPGKDRTERYSIVDLNPQSSRGGVSSRLPEQEGADPEVLDPMTDAADSPAPFVFSLNDFAEKNWTEALRDVYGRTIIRHEIEPLTAETPQFDATLRALPGLGFASGASSALRCWRTPDQIDSDDVVLNVTLAGKRSLRQLGREVDITVGDGVLTTGAYVGEAVISDGSRFISFRFPRKALAPLVVDLDARLVRRIPRDTEALRLLVHYVEILGDVRALETPELRRAVILHIHELAALAIGATGDTAELARGRGVRAARLRAVKTDVLANIGDHRLSIDAVARRQCISPVYVRKLFDADGTTFAEFVLGQRLSRAHRMLNDPRLADRKISTVAFEVGFGDLSYFNRAFRRLYGATPSDVRAAARREQ